MYGLHLIHYSDNPNLTSNNLKSFSDEFEIQEFIIKPFGFWVSISDAWKGFCLSENFRVENLTYEYDVKIKENSNLLIIQDEVHAFDLQREYKKEYGDERDELVFAQNIDWKKVRKDYNGVGVINYNRFEIKSFSWHINWYRYFDVNSICIWDISSIEDIILTPGRHLYER